MKTIFDIVLLSGPQGSGKSTTANETAALARRIGYTAAMQIKFASPLYDLHNLLLDRMERYTGLPRVKKDGVLLQLLGTEWGRQVFGENVWVDATKEIVSDLRFNYQGVEKLLVIIDDCRFENEFNAFPEALRVRLNASEEIRKSRADAWRENTLHPSEVGLDLYDLEGKFDLYLQTDLKESSPKYCATLVVAQLQKRTWLEKRSQAQQSAQR